MGELAGRCVATTHFEYPSHNCSFGNHDIATHLCFSGFKQDKYKTTYDGGVGAADTCNMRPLGCRSEDIDAYLECFHQIGMNDFTRGVYEGLAMDFQRIYRCSSDRRLRGTVMTLLVSCVLYVLLMRRY